jgi:predicted lipoprotein with Yx(FWY)xxD motif
MSRGRYFIPLAGLAVVASLGVAACGGGSTTSSATNTNPSTSAAPASTNAGGQAATVSVASTGLGNVLVDARGRTLYLFQKDNGSTSACTGECANDWPPLRSSAPTPGTGVTASLLGTTARSDGDKQVTYNGHPLYTFEADAKAGDTKGQGVNAFGALWYVVSPAGEQITATAASPAAGGSGSGGY